VTRRQAVPRPTRPRRHRRLDLAHHTILIVLGTIGRHLDPARHLARYLPQAAPSRITVPGATIAVGGGQWRRVLAVSGLVTWTPLPRAPPILSRRARRALTDLAFASGGAGRRAVRAADRRRRHTRDDERAHAAWLGWAGLVVARSCRDRPRSPCSRHYDTAFNPSPTATHWLPLCVSASSRHAQPRIVIGRRSSRDIFADSPTEAQIKEVSGHRCANDPGPLFRAERNRGPGEGN